MEQYFASKPQSDDQEREFLVEILNKNFAFKTNNGVFSKDKIDFGTRLMLEVFIEANTKNSGNLLDIGCGYGVVGIIISSFFKNLKVSFSDVNERALELTRKNIQLNNVNDTKVIESNLFEKIETKFDIILSNPPIRAGKDTVFKCYEGAYLALNENGVLYVVIQKKQGAESSIKKLIELFGNCEILEKKSGYNILCSTKMGT